MLISYYKDNNLTYTSRKRHTNLSSFVPFHQEEQRSVLLGDGANTSIKTNVSNICDYVTIDGTRWFVVNYIYLNGKQVQLNLQRDVIGEFGISNCYGKIERGYTDSILKYKKELSLNQVLKSRKYIKPNTFKYGEYSVDNHTNEMWGILYFVKPTQIDPETGEPYPEQLNINIPAFIPKLSSLENIKDDFYSYGYSSNCKISFSMDTFPYYTAESNTYKVEIIFNKDREGYTLNVSKVDSIKYGADIGVYLSNSSSIHWQDGDEYVIAEEIANRLFNSIKLGNNLYSFPEEPVVVDEDVIREYNNSIIEDDGKYYQYSGEDDNRYKYGTIGNPNSLLQFISSTIGGKSIVIRNYVFNITSTYRPSTVTEYYYASSEYELTGVVITKGRVFSFDGGTITIDTTQQLIDEPYCIMAFPLFDCVITKNEESYTINRTIAFNIFNTVIQYLSGENPYIIDAQIYPYCPDLQQVDSIINGYPFFGIKSTTYNRYSSVQLLPYKDIKKEYIQRQYSIVSPEQSGNFPFNFYDYVNVIKDNENGIDDGKNYELLDIIIKTALKPFSIISSAVIQNKGDSLRKTYSSDLRGSQPSSGGFECSLSSNQYQEYKRQNSNYQQIFNKQQEALLENQKVERQNEIASIVANVASATAMGTIAGASLTGDGGLFGAASTIGKATGGIAGGITAGTTVGVAMGAQYEANEKLREYEYNLNKEMFDLNIGTIKALPNSVNRISSFNEIILQDFWYIIETYECTDFEKSVVDNFIEQYGYEIGVFDFISNYKEDGWFLKSSLVKSGFNTNLHVIAERELNGGIYIYE